MDFPVVWSPEAIEDLESIAEYIGRDSDFYARAVVINQCQGIPNRVIPHLLKSVTHHGLGKYCPE